MKKNLFFISVAVLALGACTNDNVVEENNSVNQPNEIAIQALVTPNTRAAVDGTTFPDIDMKVAAYDVASSRNLFEATTFSKSTTTWKGGKYWPFGPTTINFLAIANANSDNATAVTWGDASGNAAAKDAIAMSDNKTAQRDLMYAIGTGENSSGFPNIPMAFKHAQAWLKFNVKAGNSTSASAITINSITVNDVSCQGTFTVTHTNFDAAAGQSAAGAWTAFDTYAGNVTAIPAGGYSSLSTTGQDFASLLVVPDQGMASFTIDYTLAGLNYTYTYTPASTTLAQATKYTYNITITIHEIEVEPTVTDWTEGGPIAVNL